MNKKYSPSLGHNKKSLLKSEVEHVDITSFDSRKIIESMKKMSFTSRDTAKAAEIYNEMINFLYKQYSKAIPIIGKFIVGSEKPYEYLIESIENFVNQDELIDLMKKSNFDNCSYRNLSGGIVSIHSGWKI